MKPEAREQATPAQRGPGLPGRVARIMSQINRRYDHSRPLHAFRLALPNAFRAHILFLALILAYGGAALLVGKVCGVSDRVRLTLYSTTLYVASFYVLGVCVIARAAYVLFTVRPHHPALYVLRDLWSHRPTAPQLAHALPVFIFLPVFMSAFTSMKSLIPDINPYCWDATWARWDGILHGGRQPWQWLHPLLAWPPLTMAINVAYNCWFFVMFIILVWQTFSSRNPRLRMQFLLTFVLCWILLGTVAAIVFSSAGPCYYGRFVPGDDLFRPLMDYLRSADESCPVWALTAQEALWRAYQSKEIGQVRGISAMPSMHLSMAFLFALTGWRSRRAVGIALSIFALLIMIGCVHLGWHYAIDGYAAMGGTWLIWWIVRRLQCSYPFRFRCQMTGR
jgi:hypothetical protein